MFSFNSSTRLLYVLSRCRVLCFSKGVISRCHSTIIKEPRPKIKKRTLVENTQVKTLSDESDTTVPIAVQILSKTLNISSNRDINDGQETLSQEDLRHALEEISWDTKAAVYKHKHSYTYDEGETVDSLESEVIPEGYTDEDFVETLTLEDESFHAGGNKHRIKGQRIAGSPDPRVPRSRIPCSGCGAELHCRDPVVPGYMPSEKFKSLTKNDLRQSVCQRCHLMSNHHICLNVKVDSSDYPEIISKIRHTKGLVIVIVDLTDIRNSIFPNLLKYIGPRRPLYIVGNKVDLICKDNVGYLTRIKDTLFEECEKAGLNYSGKNIKHLCLVSAKTGYGIEELVTNLMTSWKLQGEVFLVGCTNVGKSSIFNALLQSDYCKSHVRDIIRRATVSVWPGTTLNLLKFPVVRPEAWRLYLRRSRLNEEKLKMKAEQKLKKSQPNSESKTKYATLHGYIGQTDFRSDREKQKEKQEGNKDYEGQELVSFSMSKSGTISEVSGRQVIAEETSPDMSALDRLLPSRWTFDTPGAVNPEQIINLLTPEELQLVLPRKIVQPRVFTVKPLQVLYVSGLGRIDYCQGERSVFLTVHCSPDLPVHVLDYVEADNFLQENTGCGTLALPVEDVDRQQRLPSLIGREFRLRGIGWDIAAADIQLSSLGWVSVTIHRDHEVMLRAYTPGGRGCHVRTPALLPNVLAFRGKRIKKTAAYHPR